MRYAGTPRPLPAARPAPTRGDLARAALWLGLVGFGGGLSVLSSLHDLAVHRRRWLTDREYANTATVAQMLPGGAAANALALVGLRFHGQAGAAIAYVAHILPGAVLVFALAWAYVRFGVAAPAAQTALDGLNAAVVGIVASLTLRMVRSSVARGWQMAVAAAALLLSLGGGAAAGEVAALGVVAGLVIDLGQKRARLSRLRRAPRAAAGAAPPPVALPDEGEPLPRANEPPHPPVAALLPALALGSGALVTLALQFFRTGLGAYGGGFAIIPHLQATLVGGGQLTAHQFADAVAIGKLTPGPVLLLATFVGYVLQGPLGSIAATVAVFGGPYLLVVALGTWLIRLRSRRPVRAALRGLTPAVVGLMGAAALTLGANVRDAPSLAIAAAATLTLVRFRTSPALVLVLGGAARLAMAAAGF
jgi:chromate transporter